jgi:hypothetical protein
MASSEVATARAAINQIRLESVVAWGLADSVEFRGDDFEVFCSADLGDGLRGIPTGRAAGLYLLRASFLQRTKTNSLGVRS